MLAVWSSGSFAFSKSSLNIWKFMVHIPLKSGLESSAWEDCDCAVVWPFFGLASFWDWNETDLFQSCGYCWVFPICWNIGCSTCTASSFRIWNNSSIGIPSSLLALFVVMLPKAHLTAHSRMSDSRWGTWRSFLYSFSVDSADHRIFCGPLLNIFCFC